jgi:hypothetical protein
VNPAVESHGVLGHGQVAAFLVTSILYEPAVPLPVVWQTWTHVLAVVAP